MINTEKKIIFTHPPKCAGTSIEYALGAIPKEYKTIHDENIRFKGTSVRAMKVPSGVKLKHDSLTTHIQELEKLNENVEEYFIFSCIRNPWDRAVSRYYHDTIISVEKYKLDHPNEELPIGYQKLIDCSFEEYIQNKYNAFKNNSNSNLEENQRNIIGARSFLFHNDVYEVDFVVRFENLQEDFKEVANKINLETDKLEHIYFHNKRPKIDYREYYKDINIKNMVEEMGKDSIELFNYTF